MQVKKPHTTSIFLRDLPMNKRVTIGEEVWRGEGRRSVLQKMASVVFVFQGETSEHLRCSSEQHAGLELQAALAHEST